MATTKIETPAIVTVEMVKGQFAKASNLQTIRGEASRDYANEAKRLGAFFAALCAGFTGEEVDQQMMDIRTKCVATNDKGEEKRADSNLFNKARKIAHDEFGMAASTAYKSVETDKANAAKAKADLAAKKRLGLVDDEGKEIAQTAKGIELPPALFEMVTAAMQDQQLSDNLLRAFAAYQRGAKSCGLSYKKAA